MLVGKGGFSRQTHTKLFCNEINRKFEYRSQETVSAGLSDHNVSSKAFPNILEAISYGSCRLRF